LSNQKVHFLSSLCGCGCGCGCGCSVTSSPVVGAVTSIPASFAAITNDFSAPGEIFFLQLQRRTNGGYLSWFVIIALILGLFYWKSGLFEVFAKPRLLGYLLLLL
jgi:hypothetical protein